MATPLLLNRGGVLRRGFIKGSDLALIPSSTPPDNPSAGDLWLYSTGVQGAMWMFVYDTTETTSYKWKFIGGPPNYAHYDYPGGVSLGLSTATDIPGLSITVPRDGDYTFDASAMLTASAAGSWEWLLMLYQNGSFVPGAYYGYPIVTTPANGGVAIAGQFRVTGAAAGDVFTLRGEVTSNAGTSHATLGRLSCLPVRVA